MLRTVSLDNFITRQPLSVHRDVGEVTHHIPRLSDNPAEPSSYMWEYEHV